MNEGQWCVYWKMEDGRFTLDTLISKANKVGTVAEEDLLCLGPKVNWA